MEYARERPQPDDENGQLSREMAASLAADVAELLELAAHLDRRLRHGAGVDPSEDEGGSGVGATTSGVGHAGVGAAGEAVGEAAGEAELLDAVLAALDEAEHASLALRHALGRALRAARRLGDL